MARDAFQTPVAIPELGAEAGDWIVPQPGFRDHPIAVIRLIPAEQANRARQVLRTLTRAFGGASEVPAPASQRRRRRRADHVRVLP